MLNKIMLDRKLFTDTEKILLESAAFKVVAYRYPSGVESLKIINSRGYVELLPYMGQIIWDAQFDGISLRLKNIFSQPKKASCIIDTYGCFAFHSGLLANGCPAPEDKHIMHGEFACAEMDEAFLEVDGDTVALVSRYEYLQGFGYHYIAAPKVTLKKDSARFGIEMDVKNLTAIPMPLQYMCHMNYAYVEDGKISANVPQDAFKLRETVPAHVHPTQKWLEYNEEIKKLQQQGKSLTVLNEPDMYDPEIVFMADGLDQYEKDIWVELKSPRGYGFKTEFSSAEFNCATRWIMYNPDLQVAAFVLPSTCRPEGFLAAQKAGTLIMLDSGETRHFGVITGLNE